MNVIKPNQSEGSNEKIKIKKITTRVPAQTPTSTGNDVQDQLQTLALDQVSIIPSLTKVMKMLMLVMIMTTKFDQGDHNDDVDHDNDDQASTMSGLTYVIIPS